MFDSNIQSLISQHSEIENIEYFIKNWYENNSNWYEGFSPKNPSTNNALESFNALIKKKYTVRERLSIPKFFKAISKLIYQQSLLRSQFSKDCKTFAVEKEYSLKFWSEAFKFKKENNLSMLRVIFISLSK